MLALIIIARYIVGPVFAYIVDTLVWSVIAGPGVSGIQYATDPRMREALSH